MFGALLMAGAALQQAQAADVAVERVAMATTHGSDAASGKAMNAARTAAQRSDTVVAKATARRVHETPSGARDSDGNRFRYDSCGCSND
jgi:hypothetical protein